MSALEDRILEKLWFEGHWSARVLAYALKDVSRQEVNQTLYAMKDKGLLICDDSIPPLWSVDITVIKKSVESEPSPEPQEVMIIFTDLGNCHHILQHLVPYAQQSLSELRVFAFADLAFNGFGVNPPAPAPIQMYHSKTSDTNSADLEMIWKAAELVLDNPEGLKYHFVVATLDQGFRSLQNIVERYGHRLDFVTNWNDLRTFVE